MRNGSCSNKDVDHTREYSQTNMHCLFVSLPVSICLRVSLCLSLSLCMSRPCQSMSICKSAFLFVRVSVSACLYIFKSLAVVCLSLCACFCRSPYLSLYSCLFMCLSESGCVYFRLFMRLYNYVIVCLYPSVFVVAVWLCVCLSMSLYISVSAFVIAVRLCVSVCMSVCLCVHVATMASRVFITGV